MLSVVNCRAPRKRRLGVRIANFPQKSKFENAIDEHLDVDSWLQLQSRKNDMHYDITLMILRPLYALEVYSLLHHLPERAHFPEPRDVADAQVDRHVHLRLQQATSTRDDDTRKVMMRNRRSLSQRIVGHGCCRR